MNTSGPAGQGMFLGIRLEVLRAGLFRFRGGDVEAGETLRRIGKAIGGWALQEGASEILDATRALDAAHQVDLLEKAEALEAAIVTRLAEEGLPPGESDLILAVEDSPEESALLESVLAAPGRELWMATTTEEAARVLREENVALVVLDLGLPDQDGRNFLLELRESEAFRDLPVVVLTGKIRPEVKAESLALGANAVFEKPMDAPAFAAAIARELHEAADRRLLARTDRVTGLLNRDGFKEAWSRRGPDESQASLGILSLDRFHQVEERFGAEVADRVLASVGRLLSRHAPAASICCRWGRSDFLFLCPGTGRLPVVPRMRSLLEDVRGLAHADPDREMFRVTASGAVVDVEPGLGIHEVLGLARERLAVAEDAGGNTMADVVSEEKIIRVLLAEDDPMSAGIVQHRLEKEGFQVLHFLDGAQALEGALANKVHLAILDVKMPEMDGFELLEKLRKIPAFQDIPIMMLTSMGREEDVVRGLKLGADDYMLKPFSPVELVARIRRLLDR